MSEHRLKRLEEEIHHILSNILLFETENPNLKTITVTRVLLTKDVSTARIYYEDKDSTSENKKKLQKHLVNAQGYFRKQLAQKLDLRAVPVLEFFYDEVQEEISRVNRLLDKI